MNKIIILNKYRLWLVQKEIVNNYKKVRDKMNNLKVLQMKIIIRNIDFKNLNEIKRLKFYINLHI
jgi:hypothetical protein